MSYLLVFKCELRCLLHRIRVLWLQKITKHKINKRDEKDTVISTGNVLDEDSFLYEKKYVDNKLIAWTNINRHSYDGLLFNEVDEFNKLVTDKQILKNKEKLEYKARVKPSPM